MKKIFWILLLANVVLFVVMQLEWLGGSEQASQAQPALHGDMIRLVEAPPVAPPAPAVPDPVPAKAPVIAPVPVKTPVVASAPVHAPIAASSPVSVKEAASAPATAPTMAPALASSPAGEQSSELACLEWGEFSGQDLTRAKTALSALQLGDRLNQYQFEHDIGYWVYIPPLPNKAAVNRKIGELKARGVKEFFVVQDAGQWRNAISLGVFKTREAAQKFLDDLRAKGVRTARFGQRSSKFNVTIFRLNGINIMTEVKLAAIQKEFAGSELKRVPCTLTR